MGAKNNEESNMINFYDIEPAEKEAIFNAISNQTGMPAFAVEKDWWVTQTLGIIFEMEVGRALVFKGGTSLSKAWKLIERFSEDVDLAIDRKFLGFTGNLSKKERTNLRKTAGEYTTSAFFEELQACFKDKGFDAVELKVVDAVASDQDPRIIEIHYPNIIETPGYMLPRVQIEIGCRSLIEPYSIKEFGSLVDETYPEGEFASPFINVPTVDAERTFLEKLFLLHEEFNRPVEKIRVDRLSRHMYDVYHLSQNDKILSAIEDQNLYETIVAHRYEYAKIGGVDYNKHNPVTLDPIPHADFIKAWEADYNKMKSEMIYEQNPPSFQDLVENIEQLKKKLSSVSWKFSLEFDS
jgi:predicted nucleotidyltransferase component of viral defense system